MGPERLIRMIALAEAGKLNTEIGKAVGLKRARVAQIFKEAGRLDLCGYTRRSASGCHRPPNGRSERKNPTQGYVRAALDYNPETGEFRWRKRKNMHARWNAKHAGKKAGGLNRKTGYYEIRLDNVLYAGHVLAWIHAVGRIRRGLVIDHRDGDRSNTKLVNLRVVTYNDNRLNTAAHRAVHGLPPPAF